MAVTWSMGGDGPQSVRPRTQEEYLRWVRRMAAHTGVACASLTTQEEVLTFLHWLIKKFLRRWSLPVLPKGLMRVRHYGFLSAAGKKRRERVASIPGVQPPELPPVATDPDQAESAVPDGSGIVPPTTSNTSDAGEKARSSVPPCPCCGKTMEFVRRIKHLDLWIRTPLTPRPTAAGWTLGQARPPNLGSPPRPAMQLNQPSIQPIPVRQPNLSWTDRSGACVWIPAPVKKGPFSQQFSIPTSRRAMPKARTGLKKQST